jgi:capsular polysaccharide transport system permease protein
MTTAPPPAPAPDSDTAQAPASEPQAVAPTPAPAPVDAPDDHVEAKPVEKAAAPFEEGVVAGAAAADRNSPKASAAKRPPAASVSGVKSAARKPGVLKSGVLNTRGAKRVEAKAPTPKPSGPATAREPSTPAAAKPVAPQPMPVPLPAPVRASQPPKTWIQRIDKIFLLTVALPTLLVAIYFGFMASDVYISESRFVVRNPQRPSTTDFGALLAGAGFTRSQDDNYTVQSYVMSRDALRELEDKLKLSEAYGSKNIDVFSRFPGLGWDDSFEALFKHYTDHVAIAYDSASSITTMEVRAYTPEMSRAINEVLLQVSERLVNNLNDRSRQDLIVVARRQVKEAEKRTQDASLALVEFRSKGGIFDPAKEAGMLIDTAARLREDLRMTETQIARLKEVAPANPQIATLNQQAARLRDAIGQETSKTVGPGNSLNTKSTAYERLALEKQFSEQELAAALANLEMARNDAARKQLYLERLVQPNLPDMALEPRRVRSVFTVFLVGLLVWGVVSLLVAGVREHAD